MNATKIISTDEAQRLLDGATPGPWQWSRETSPERTESVRLRGPIMGHERVGLRVMAPAWPHPTPADASLIAAAPDLARTVIAQDTDLARLRALVEQHEERARVHAEERAAHHGEMARVTGECETLRRTLALAQESLAAASSGRRVTVVDEIGRLTRERDEAHAAIASLREEISDAADTLRRLSLAQQRLASAGDRGAWATSGAYARAAQIVAGIGDPAARAATGGAS